MTSFRKTTNALTGAPQVQFAGKLISVEDEVQTLNNAKQTQYRYGIAEFVTPQGQLKTSRVQIWEKNYTDVDGNPKMEVGKEYNITGEVQEGTNFLYLNMAAFTPTSRATAEDFGVIFGDEDVDVDAPALREKTVAEFN